MLRAWRSRPAVAHRRAIKATLSGHRSHRCPRGARYPGSRDVEWCRTVAPGVEDVLDTTSHLCSRRFALGAGHEEVVVIGVDMSDGGHDGESDGVRFQRLPGGASPDAATAACCRVKRDRVGAQGRTTRELFTNRRIPQLGMLSSADLVVDGQRIEVLFRSSAEAWTSYLRKRSS